MLTTLPEDILLDVILYLGVPDVLALRKVLTVAPLRPMVY